MSLDIPVLELEAINEAKTKIEEMISFLTGDSWELNFRKREYSEYEMKIFGKIKDKKSGNKIIKNICMLSGGLDSFIGAIDLLNQRNDVVFISHYGGGKGTHEYQELIKELFIENYHVDSKQFYSFYAAAHDGKEETTRSRSFMFFSHALAIASSFNRSVKLIIPENGLISLNIPLSFSRVGSSSTRTTHPYYMKMFQEVMDILELNIEFYNPYQFKTKGEMIIECSGQEILGDNIESTMSCSHPDIGRMNGEKEAYHCGNCLPCVIRRSAIKRAYGYDTTGYRDLDFTSGETAKTNLNSYLLGVNRFNEKRAFMDIQKAGAIVDRIEDYTSLYIRGMKELENLLEEYRNA